MMLLRWVGEILLVATLVLVSFANFSQPLILPLTLGFGILGLGILMWCEYYLYEQNRQSIFMDVLTNTLDGLEVVFEILSGIAEILGGLL